MKNKNTANSGGGFWCRLASVLLCTSILWVSDSALAATKSLYLETTAAPARTLTRIAATTSNNTSLANGGGSSSWGLPALTKAVTLDTSGTLSVTLVRGETGGGAWRNYTVELSGDSVGVVATWTGWEDLNPTLTNALALTFDTDFTSTDNSILPDGEVLTLTITNITANNGRTVEITDVGSQIDLPSQTVVNVDSVTFYNDVAGAPGSVITSANPNDTVWVKAVISDPFGSADINPPTGAAGLPSITLSGVTATGSPGTMILEATDAAAGTKTYRFQTTVTSVGTLQADITATEGYETGAAEVTHTGAGTLTFAGAALNLIKYVSEDSACADELTTLTDIVSGTDVYYCYTVINTGTETFSVASTDITDNRGIDLSSSVLVDTYAAGVSKTHNAGPFTTGTDEEVPIGTTVNTANVSATWASGTLIDSAQASLTVITAAPSSGNKSLYLETTAAPARTLTRIAATVTNTTSIAGAGGSNSWALPALTKEVTLDTSGALSVTLVRGETGGGDFRNYAVTLSGNTVGAIATRSGWEDLNPTLTNALALTFDTDFTSTDNSILPDGEVLTLTITNNTAQSNRPVVITDVGSQIDLASQTVINVDSVTFYDEVASAPGSLIAVATPGDVIWVKAVISDPFGSADINPSGDGTGIDGDPDITLSGVTASGSPGYMELESTDTGAGTKTYRFQTTVTSAGTLQADVTATEGYENSPAITHTLPGYLPIAAANLTIVKSSNKASAKPGQLITYTVTVANTGVGAATAVEIGDAMSGYSAFALDPFGNSAGDSQPFNFTLTNTSTSSTLAFGTADYATIGPVWGKALSDGAGSAPAGYDGLVTNWKATFTGNLQAGDQFTLQYGTTVK